MGNYDENTWRNTPDLSDDDIGSQIKEIYSKYKSKIKIGALAMALAFTGLSTVYTNPKDSVGVVQTFGEYTSTTKPGLHFKIPLVQKVTKVQNQAIFTESFGFRTLKSGIKTEYVGVDEIKAGKISENDLADIVSKEGLSTDGDIAAKALGVLKGEYLMLTGDLNMGDVEWIVQYRISDPAAYIFNIKNAVKTLRDVSEATMRVTIGDASIDEILTAGRAEIEGVVKRKLQNKLTDYNTGLEVDMVQLQSSNPPEAVRPSFNLVTKSLQDKETKINNAREEYNTQIPKAEGVAQGTIQEAEGYASNRVNTALGDVARFNQIYEQYKRSPAVTRTRMYLEAMPSVLQNAKSIYYVEDNSGMMLKKLDLNTLGGN